jgi:hypothetical protein
MRTRYLYVNPRGFATEYSIYRITSRAQLAEAQRLIATARGTEERVHFITRDIAEAHCRSNRKLRKTYLRGGLNLSQNPVACTEIVDLELSE